MSKVSINRISGNGNVFGNNNNVANNITIYQMTNEEILREEANSFTQNNVESKYYLANGHKEFIDELRLELSNYYTVEAKMIFLDQIKNNVEKYIYDFRAEVPDSDLRIIEKMLFFVNQEINDLPKIVRGNPNNSQNRTSVFISYSRKDSQYLDELRRHFKPLENRIEFWEDSKLIAGKKWKDEISVAIQKAKVGILLLSADFFNSDFISLNELPPLLNKANEEGATILSIILRPCLFEEYPDINQYQALNDPTKPICFLDENSRETMWVELVRQVKYITEKT